MSNFALATEPPPLVRLLTSSPRGAGFDQARVEQSAGQLRVAYHDSLAITYREAALAETFRTHAEEWRRATRFQSSLEEITGHPAYRAIVLLGDEVVPLLLRELRRRPELWFAALREITHADPVRPEYRGDISAMADAWVRWGRERGLTR